MPQVDPESTTPSPRPIRLMLSGWLGIIGLLSLLAVGALRMGPLPALGPLLDPVAGVWSAARQARPASTDSVAVANLNAAVDVYIDNRGVPHVYASSIPDAVRALGYLQARDRLFQLELQTKAAAGRLTELFGASPLDIDQQQRRLGLADSAERAWQALDPTSFDHALYQALADGINAHIDNLGRNSIPFEYHFLDHRPERWQPVNSLLVERRMSHTLCYNRDDLWRLRAEGLVGKAAADALYPVNSPIQEPIQPSELGAPWLLREPIPPPAIGNASLVHVAEQLLAAAPPSVPQTMVIGSNNWAIAAGRSATGHALLANDPHLQLTLPSIWYEAHLVVKDRMNVHGVTIPGVPVIIIGFTPNVAWSVTNNRADVIDFYYETLDSVDQPGRYLLDGNWQPLRGRPEQYYGKDGELLAEETRYYTHRGPLLLPTSSAVPSPVSMRWLALEHGASPSSFQGAASADSVDELLAALADFAAPAQNFIMADADGRIAMRSTGLYPIRPGDGDGRSIRDGSTTQSDWIGYWPLELYPQSIDPAQHYLASANQQPIAASQQPLYLGSNWPSPWRALHINGLLRASPTVSLEDMRAYQTDPGNHKARLLTPYFLSAAAWFDEVAAPAAVLQDWDYRYTSDAQAPLLFERALDRLEALLWDELQFEFTELRELPTPPTPERAILYALLKQPDNPWWDDRRTGEREDRDYLLRKALASAYAELVLENGPPVRRTPLERKQDTWPEAAGLSWRWSNHRRANINHLALFPGLGRTGLTLAGGAPGNLNPSSGDGTHGASWRMVVELAGAQTQARAVYPGGQSGNPASRLYDDRLAAWQTGELEPVYSPESPEQFDAGRAIARLRLVPGTGDADAEAR